MFFLTHCLHSLPLHFLFFAPSRTHTRTLTSLFFWTWNVKNWIEGAQLNGRASWCVDGVSTTKGIISLSSEHLGKSDNNNIAFQALFDRTCARVHPIGCICSSDWHLSPGISTTAQRHSSPQPASVRAVALVDSVLCFLHNSIAFDDIVYLRLRSHCFCMSNKTSSPDCIDFAFV